MQKIKVIIKKFYSNIFSILKAPHFGFIQGHDYFENQDLTDISKLIGVQDDELISNYEKSFSNLVGEGDCVSFASGRMGFYAVMKLCDIGDGDEVIINGATCSVMVNAIFRCGALPVYSDIDPETFGSSYRSIKRCITKKTKMIVAQHSFGIPCEIDHISNLCKKSGIFLLEDCALSLGSKLDNINVGNFGDAALFSTDHSKPINTINGGLIYTKNITIYNKLRQIQSKSSILPIKKQLAIWRRFLLEKKYARPGKFHLLNFFDLIHRLKLNITGGLTPFLDEDFGSKIVLQSYPYPSKIPTFVAAIGLREINRWPHKMKERVKMLNYFSKWVLDSNFNLDLPNAYFDTRRHIVPLRIVWSQKNGPQIRQQIASLINISWIWFLRPIIGSIEPLINFKYKDGECPISEKTCLGMVNIPTALSFQSLILLLEMISPVFNKKIK